MKLLDIVALIEDLPELNLERGQAGTIVEEYEPGVYEVEFSESSGRAYAIETLREKQLMQLHHRAKKPTPDVQKDFMGDVRGCEEIVNWRSLQK